MDDIPYTYAQPTPEEQGNPSSGLATAALILGICSIVFACCGGSFLFGALGIILALLSRGGTLLSQNAKIGLGLSVAGFVLSVVITIVAFVGFFATSSGQDFANLMKEAMEGNLSTEQSQENMEKYLYDYLYDANEDAPTAPDKVPDHALDQLPGDDKSL